MKIKFVPSLVSQGKPRNALKRELVDAAKTQGVSELVISARRKMLRAEMPDGSRYEMEGATARELRVVGTAVLRASAPEGETEASGDDVDTSDL